MGQMICKHACLLVLIFSSALLISGCVPEEQSEGYKLYSAKCSSCHRLLPPENYTIEKLEEYIAKYGKEITVEEKGRLVNALKEYKLMKAGK